MADTYAVSVAQVAAKLPGLFPAGFTTATHPTAAEVSEIVSTADTIVTLRVQDATGGVPLSTDKAAPVAVQFILNWVIAEVLKVVYAGNDPERLAAIVKPYLDMVTAYGLAIDGLGAQAIGTGESAPRVLAGPALPTRDLLITDADLDACSGLRGRF
jgi:hypothetical protein